MKTTRRDFIAQTAAAGVVAATLVPEIAPAASSNPALEKAMDAIIPAGDGMPSATEAGGFRYLTQLISREPAIAASIERCLAALQRISSAGWSKPFAELAPDDVTASLTRFEAQQPDDFALLRNYVYESYYTQAAIWKLIGYEFYPTDHPGPHMQPFDDSVLGQVRAMPKHYREDERENG
ncbi:MAG: gluconate 2-dehydrogenase subunit 3 family protein [Acidobacteriaceae bacterium]|nr:gluconate 2-dehydrogenase subunit 3 family protein [Acidobacteriaceae bacterium]